MRLLRKLAMTIPHCHCEPAYRQTGETEWSEAILYLFHMGLRSLSRAKRRIFSQWRCVNRGIVSQACR